MTNPALRESESALPEAVMNRLYLGAGNMVTDKFVKQYEEVIGLIDEVRSNLGLPAYPLAARVVLANQMHLEALRHRGHTRKNGDDYFDAHIIGTVTSVVGDQHLTGLPTIISALGHDTTEDLGIPAKEIVNPEILLPKTKDLKGGDEKMLFDIKRQVIQMVSGLTKVERATRRETKAATITHILAASRTHNTRVANIKLSDRTDNMRTLEGLGEDKKTRQKEIAHETDTIYRPLAHFFQAHQIEVLLTELCAQALNPQLLHEYWSFVNAKKKEVLNQYEEKIRAQFWKNGKSHPAYTEAGMPLIVSQPLAHALNRERVHRPIEEVSLDDLRLDDMDPQFDIVVLVKGPEHIHRMIGHIIERFSSSGFVGNTRSLINSRGVLLRIFSKEFGGKLYFRVNDRRSEAHSRRGVLANMPDKVPPFVGEAISQVLVEVKEGKDIYDAMNILTAMKKACCTPSNDRVELAANATVLDFAGKLHDDILRGAVDSSVRQDMWGKAEPFSLFRSLPVDSVVQVSSALSSKKRPGKETLMMGTKTKPEWLHYCQEAETKAKVREFLRKLSPEVQKKRASEYLSRLQNIFGIGGDEIVKALTPPRGQEKKVPQSIMQEIGIGTLDPLQVVAKWFQGKTHFKIEVDITEDPTTSILTHESFGKGINPESVPSTTEIDGRLLEVVEVNTSSEQSMREFLVTIQRLSLEGNNIVVYPVRKTQTRISIPPGKGNGGEKRK